MTEFTLWRGFTKKVTPKIKKKMATDRAKGATYREIAIKFNLAESTVRYHLDERERERSNKAARAYMKEHPQPYGEYLRDYMHERYQKDKEFRGRLIGHIMKYQKKIQDRNREVIVGTGSKLKCPYCGDTWKVRNPYVPLKCPKCVCVLVKLPKVIKKVK